MGSGIILSPEFVSQRPLPANFRAVDHALFSHELSRVISQSHLLDLEGVSISPRGMLFKRGRVLPQSFASELEALEWSSLKQRAKLLVSAGVRARLNRFEGTAIWVTDTKSDEFFHWMADALPRLLSVRELLPDATLLLPASYAAKSYITESLKSFEIGQIVYVDQMTRCRRLLIPTPPGCSGNYHDELMRDLRVHLRSSFAACVPPVATDRVYISRARAPKRRLLNEQGVFETLEPLGFHRAHFEDHPFQEQMAIMMQTRHLVSNHGAGLANMLLMPPGSTVLELRKEGDAHNNCYFALAAALDLRYFYQVCPAGVADENAFSADLIVDTGALRENVVAMTAA